MSAQPSRSALRAAQLRKGRIAMANIEQEIAALRLKVDDEYRAGLVQLRTMLADMSTLLDELEAQGPPSGLARDGVVR